MTEAEVKAVAKLIDMLRAKGVRTFSGMGVELQLEERQEAKPKASELAPASEPVCACGHPFYAHQDGLCVADGCDADTCSKSLEA